jgi:hypothetical protein
MPDTSDHDAPTWLLTMGDIRTLTEGLSEGLANKPLKHL